ncbi:MAG: GMP/IMP nucleotidase [Arenicellales bacterium]
MIDWNNIDTVFLDMDGTLLDLRFDNHFWLNHVPMRYAELHNISVEAAKQVLFPKMQALRGQLSWYCTDFWSNELDLPIIELKQEVSHLIQTRPHVLPFLDGLKAAGKELVLFTNAHEDTLGLKMQKTGLTGAFDKTITSHSLGHAKEAIESWQTLQKNHDFKPETSVFIDDSFSVLDCAQKFGIQYLFGIALPDSSRDALRHDEYTLLESFEQIMPGSPLEVSDEL